jgi:hypothetical protein
MSDNPNSGFWRQVIPGIVVGVIVAVAGAGSEPFWWHGLNAWIARPPLKKFEGTWEGSIPCFGVEMGTYAIREENGQPAMTAQWNGRPKKSYPCPDAAISFENHAVVFNDAGRAGALHWVRKNWLEGTIDGRSGSCPFQLFKQPPDQ